MDSCWIITHRYPYEGDQIVGVAATEEVANRLMQEYVDELNAIHQKWNPDTSRIWRMGKLDPDDSEEYWHNGYESVAAEEWDITT